MTALALTLFALWLLESAIHRGVIRPETWFVGVRREGR